MRIRSVALAVLVPALAVAKDAPPPDPSAALVARLEAIASASSTAAIATPRFAFTSDLTLDAPATLADARFGLPAIAVADPAKHTVDVVDADTAIVSANLGEYAACAKPGCKGIAPETWLRGTVVLDRIGDAWQPLAWSITPPIPGEEQVLAMAAKIAPDRIKRDTAGADDVAKVFETSMADVKLLAASVADKPEVVLYGSELAERYTTGKAVKQQLASWGLAFKVHDGVRAGVSAHGTVAWVAANVDGTFVRPKTPPVPYRVFVVYEKIGGAWKAVALQFSTSV